MLHPCRSTINWMWPAFGCSDPSDTSLALLVLLASFLLTLVQGYVLLVTQKLTASQLRVSYAPLSVTYGVWTPCVTGRC